MLFNIYFGFLGEISVCFKSNEHSFGLKRKLGNYLKANKRFKFHKRTKDDGR